MSVYTSQDDGNGQLVGSSTTQIPLSVLPNSSIWENVTCFWDCKNISEVEAALNAPRGPGVLEADTQFIVGLALAICSSLFIGASFIVKKKSLLRLAAKGNGLRAAEGGMGYLTDWVWWTGLLVMAVGEAANFAAYAFVPASLVTPLGALSVVVTAVLASFFLKERLNLIGKMACMLCLLGSTVTVLHAPKEGEVTTLMELATYLSRPEFVVYLLLVVVASIALIFFLAPKWGNSNIFIYIVVCSLIGSLSVMMVKAVGLAINDTIRGVNAFSNGLTYVFIAALLVCVSVQMIYLNKALDMFNTSVVSPIYYVLFTASVMVASGILYGEFTNLSWFNCVGLAVGFAVITVGVFLLHLFKDYEIGFRDVSYVFGPQGHKSTTIIIPTRHMANSSSTSRNHSSSSQRGFGYSKDSLSGERLPLIQKATPLEMATGVPSHMQSNGKNSVSTLVTQNDGSFASRAVGEVIVENFPSATDGGWMKQPSTTLEVFNESTQAAANEKSRSARSSSKESSRSSSMKLKKRDDKKTNPNLDLISFHTEPGEKTKRPEDAHFPNSLDISQEAEETQQPSTQEALGGSGIYDIVYDVGESEVDASVLTKSSGGHEGDIDQAIQAVKAHILSRRAVMAHSSEDESRSSLKERFSTDISTGQKKTVDDHDAGPMGPGMYEAIREQAKAVALHAAKERDMKKPSKEVPDKTLCVEVDKDFERDSAKKGALMEQARDDDMRNIQAIKDQVMAAFSSAQEAVDGMVADMALPGPENDRSENNLRASTDDSDSSVYHDSHQDFSPSDGDGLSDNDDRSHGDHNREDIDEVFGGDHAKSHVHKAKSYDLSMIGGDASHHSEFLNDVVVRDELSRSIGAISAVA